MVQRPIVDRGVLVPQYFGVPDRSRPALPPGPSARPSARPSIRPSTRSSSVSDLWADDGRGGTVPTNDRWSTDENVSPTPFEIFIERAVGAGSSTSTLINLPAAMASVRNRSRAVVVAVALIVAAGLGWWVLSAVGAAGTPMDPDLPFAAGVGPAASDEAAGGSVANPAEGNSPSREGSDGLTGNSATSAPDGSTAEESGKVTTMVVHVAGSVMVPGVHVVGPGGRVHDAVLAAGGPRHDADLDRLNLAGPVADGQRVYVPAIGEVGLPPLVDDVAAPPVTPGQQSSRSPDGLAGPLSLSVASSVDLQRLPGVGPSTAEAIIAHREANGPFTSVDGLLDVRGIGPAKLSAIRDLVVP